MRQVWRKEQRFRTRWSSPHAREEGDDFEGAVVGIRPADPHTGLLPWAALQVGGCGGAVRV